MNRKSFDKAYAAICARVMDITGKKALSGGATIYAQTRSRYYEGPGPGLALIKGRSAKVFFSVEESGIFVENSAREGVDMQLIPFEEITGLSARITGNAAISYARQREL